MDTESQKLFDEITAKEPAALSPADVAFLRARRSYLNGEQREQFAEVLEDADEPKGPYDGLSAAKLKKLAKEREIEIAGDASPEDIIAALTAADAAQ